LTSRCLPYYQNTTFYPLIGLLEQLLGFEGDDSAAVRLEKLGRMLAVCEIDHPAAVWLLSLLLGLPTGTSAPETITPRQRDQMSALSMALLQKCANAQPLVLVIEDLHWSDPSTVDWLGESLAAVSSVPCLTLLTARPGFQPNWLSEASLPPNLLLLALQPLPAEQAEAIVTDLAGEHGLVGDLHQRIVAQADGNPLFIEEMTKTLLEQAARPGSAVHTAEIPATLQDLLATPWITWGSPGRRRSGLPCWDANFLIPSCKPARRMRNSACRMIWPG
jgi:predicted ATPase